MRQKKTVTLLPRILPVVGWWSIGVSCNFPDSLSDIRRLFIHFLAAT